MNKLFIKINNKNEIIVLTNESNKDPKQEYYEINHIKDIEFFHPIYDENFNTKYKFINNQIIEKSSDEKSLELQQIEDEKNDLIIKDKLLKNDLSIIRALIENDTIKIE
ncbi:MAG TPA: hypothetical protein PLO94_06625, partial [Chitinophagales bacterium]|nr:hypothetical protein [Chitinophagales bacterium]